MKKWNIKEINNNRGLLFIVALISIIIGMFIATLSFYQGFERGRGFLAFALESSIKDDPAVQKALGIQEAFRLVAKTVIPAVVNISTETVVRQSFNFQDDPFFRFFGEDWFKHFFGGPKEREFTQKALGTGVIISDDGFILTNVHVVQNASKIIVKLQDGTTYKAKVVGLDTKTDLALIKINPKNDLPVAPLGDSDEIQIGDWAIAIGNPFGFSQTYTVGVISAKGRSGISPDASRYENYIQTDASINPGNSGGPLLNIKGEVIGINNAIVSPSGGNVGIGFAIPINMAKKILPDLKDKGKVTRGWLGVTIQDLDEKIAKPLKIKPHSGVLVASVLKNSPADKGGLKTGDIIIEFDGKEVNDSNKLRNTVADVKPGESVKVLLLRKGKKMTLKIKIGEMPSDEQIAKTEQAVEGWLGMKAENITAQYASQFNLDSDESGVIVVGVAGDSTAGSQGIQVGDVIKKINNNDIKNIDDFTEFTKKYGKEDSFLFLIKRGGNLFFLGIEKE
ncbi:MAG: DegQ family serine endoprotease [Spirochaetes bacterium]|nr:DegQ family serine endoprotease [Spirochaetota bacterium]